MVAAVFQGAFAVAAGILNEIVILISGPPPGLGAGQLIVYVAAEFPFRSIHPLAVPLKICDQFGAEGIKLTSGAVISNVMSALASSLVRTLAWILISGLSVLDWVLVAP